MNKNVFYSVAAVLLAIALYLFIQLRNAEKEVKDLEFSIQVIIDGRAAELKAEREIAEVKVKDIQVVVDSLKKADSIEDIKFKKTSLYYERKM
jgi:soluble P-type ATPase